MISFDVSKRLDFIPKKGVMQEATRKEIMFEICYSPFISSSSTRRTALSNSVLIGKLARAKNIILSSGATDKLFHRTPFEIESLYFQVSLWCFVKFRGF
jgi:RNase P/RNase MRP subunit p30